MKIPVTQPEPRRLAEEAAKILGVPSETVMVKSGPDGVEVSIGTLSKEGFKVTGDVPSGKQSGVRAWAQAMLNAEL